jgi:SAM-dependent methyltransferase
MNDDTAAARWQRLVTDRVAEAERLSAGPGFSTPQAWDARASRWGAGDSAWDTTRDPLIRRLRALTGPASTVIDAGAGAGRFALTLARHVRRVVAVDHSDGMLEVLRRRAADRGIANVDTVHARWEDADVPPADVVFSSFVMTLVRDPTPFVDRLEAAARDRVLLYLGAYSGDAVLDPLWRHFHGEPRAPGPSYLDALAVLRERGIEPRVKVVEIPNPRRFATPADAVENYREGLLLADTAEIREELERLLGAWLLGRRGALRSPLRTVPAAILEWKPPAKATSA